MLFPSLKIKKRGCYHKHLGYKSSNITILDYKEAGMHKEVLIKLLSYSQELKNHDEIYQLLLFRFQEKQTEHFFSLINETLQKVNPIFQTVFRPFLKDKDKIINALELPYSDTKPEATNNIIKVIKRNAFGFRKMTTLKKGFWLP